MKQLGGLAALVFALSCTGKTLEVGSNGGFGQPEVIVRGLLQTPANMISDGTDLFWLDFNASEVWTAPTRGGGAPAKRIASNASSSEFLYQDAAEVFYLTVDGIEAAPKAGGSSRLVVKTLSTVTAATVAEGVAYWVEPIAGTPPTRGGALLQVSPLARPATRTLANLGLGTWAAIAVTSADVLVADTRGVFAVPLAGGAPRTVSLSLRCVDLLGVPDGAYCAQRSSLGNPPLVFITNAGTTSSVAAVTSDARSLATDSSQVYWVNDSSLGGGVEALPLRGGDAVPLTHDADCRAVAVDAGAVYWSEPDGTIRRALRDTK